MSEERRQSRPNRIMFAVFSRMTPMRLGMFVNFPKIANAVYYKPMGSDVPVRCSQTSMVPWPIIWMAGAFSKKFIFPTGVLPDFTPYRDELLDFGEN